MRRVVVGAVIWLVVGALSGPVVTRAAVPERCPGTDLGEPGQAFTGSFGTDVQGSYVMVPFEVASGVTKVQVKLCHDQPGAPTSSQIKHTLDLGLYDAVRDDGSWDEEEFRGWGGSSRPHAWVSPEGSTVGYLPGAMPEGTWAAEIGVAAVVPQTQGDDDGAVAWRLEVYTSSDPTDADEPWLPTPYDEAPASTEPGWYSGDFHVHAEHSNPNDASMRETFDYAFKEAGLDFITLSDYVTSRHWDEIGRFQADYPGKLVVRSSEVITYRGHTNNHASVTYVDHRTGPVLLRKADGTLQQIRAARPASEVFDAVHAGGGWTQVNHPTIFPSEVPGFSNMCRGCPWDYSDAETDWSKVDAFEVQTGPAGTPEPKGHELGPSPFTPLAVKEWDDLRNRGYRITAVGSSDSHHAGETPGGVTQSPIGEATTVVYAPELSERGIQQGIEAGHAYVKFFSPAGPDLRLEATSLDPGSSATAIMGDALTAGRARIVATANNIPLNEEPRVLLILKDGVPMLSLPSAGGVIQHTFEVTEPGNYRLQLMRGSAVEALTNPITLEIPAPGGRLLR